MNKNNPATRVAPSTLPGTPRRQRLYCAVLLTLGWSLQLPATAQSYLNYDGSRTNDLDAAVASWTSQPEFTSDWGLKTINAQYAFAAGLSGQGVKLGSVDSGLLLTHREFVDRAPKALTVSGTYANDGAQFQSGAQAWRAGDSFNVAGGLSALNDKHGSHVSGTIAAAKNGEGMMGVAFGSDYHITNSNGTDGSIYGANVDYNYFKAAYGNLADAGVRVINSSWGTPDSRDDSNTIAGVTAAYRRLEGAGKRSWLDAAAEVTRAANTLMVWAAGNTGKSNINVRSALPYFRPELESNWIAVAALNDTLALSAFSNQCGLARYWCLSAPGASINSLNITSDTALVAASGTSMAAPHVTGAAGLLMQRYPGLDNQAIRTILLTTATHLGSGPDSYPNAMFGWGVPDLKKALAGPAQLLGVFNANIAGGSKDSWSNDISEAALIQRKSEDAAQLRAWQALSPTALQAAVDSAVANATARVKAYVDGNYDAAVVLIQTRAERNAAYQASKLTRDKTAYQAANTAVNNDPLASQMLKQSGGGALPSKDEILPIMIALDPDVAPAMQALGDYQGQSAYLEAVRRKTDADYVGTLVKTGAGSLTLAGNNSYSGGTQLQGGTLAVASATALGTGSLAMSEGTTLQAAADQLTLANAVRISGSARIDTQDYRFTLTGGITDGSTPGNLIKLGNGTLRLGSAPSHRGNTTISAGTLSVPSYTQSASQTLGFGAVSTVQYGKLAVDGRAAFPADARLAVDVASVNTLGRGQRLASVISAGTLEATRFTVSDNSLLFDFQAAINGNAVDLNIVDAVSVARVVQQAAAVPAAVGAAAVAPVLDRQIAAAPRGDMANVVSALGRLPDAPSVARAAAQTLPRNLNASAIRASLGTINRVLASRIDIGSSSAGSSGLSYGDAAADRQVWLMPFESRTNQGDRDGQSGFSASTSGMAAGLESDLAFGRVGLSYAYGSTSANGNTAVSGTATRSRIESNLLALYGSMPLGPFALGWQADLGWNSNRLSRDMLFGGLKRTASSHYGTLDMHAGARLSQTVMLGEGLSLVPALQVDYTTLNSRAYSEDGAGALNLNVAAKRSNSLLVGAQGRLIYALNPRAQISGHAGASYDLLNDRNDMVAAYAGSPGQSFTAPGTAQSPWLFRSGLSYRYQLLENADISLRYDVEGRRGFINQSASLKGGWRF